MITVSAMKAMTTPTAGTTLSRMDGDDDEGVVVGCISTGLVDGVDTITPVRMCSV